MLSFLNKQLFHTKKYIIFCIIIIANFVSKSQTYQIDVFDNDTINTCTGTFVDSRNCSSNNGYCNNENYKTTICSDNGDTIQVDFGEFNIEKGFSSEDTLYVYDGAYAADSLLIYELYGSHMDYGSGGSMPPGYHKVRLTASGECLTFVFHSDNISGFSPQKWTSTIHCETPPPPCNFNPVASDMCKTATPICNLDGYCGNTSDFYGRDFPGDFRQESGNSMFLGTIENNSWLKFQAADDSAIFHIDATSCSNNDGIQIAIYDAPQCDSFVLLSDYHYTSATVPVTNEDIIATPLTIGKIYYIMIDGFGGDVCNYEVTAEKGIAYGQIANDTAIACGDTATLIATGGITYQWSVSPYSTPDPSLSGQENNATIKVTPKETTVYYIEVISGNTTYEAMCPDLWDSVIVEVVPDTVSFDFTSPICPNQPATFTYTGSATPADDYYWYFENGSQDSAYTQGPHQISYTTAGDFEIILNVVLQNGCPTYPDTGNIHVTDITIQKMDSANPTCNGIADGIAEIAVIDGTPPYDYAWSPNVSANGTANGLIGGTYSVVVTDNNHCKDSTVFNLQAPPTLVIQTADSSNILCKSDTNGFIAIEATGGTQPYTYNWPVLVSSDSLVTGLSAGSYTVEVTDAQGCFGSQTITLTEPDSLLINPFAAITQPLCFGDTTGSIAVSVSGGTTPYAYNWQETNDTLDSISNISAGNYHLIVTDSNNCIDSTQFTITQPNQLILTLDSVQSSNISCNGFANGSISLDLSGGTQPYTYNWSPMVSDTNFADSLAEGIYHIVVSDTNQCSDSISVNLTAPQSLEIDVVDSSMITCNGLLNGIIAVQGVGGTPPYTYYWPVLNISDSIITNQPAGNYTVEVTDANNCFGTKTIAITQPDSLLIQGTASLITPLCFGDSSGIIEVSVSGGTQPYFYQWLETNDTTDSISGLAAGNYHILVTDSNNCIDSAEFILNQPDLLIVNLDTANTHNVTCNGLDDATAGVLVTGGTTPYTYVWTPNVSDTAFADSLPAGNYTVMVTDTNGCSGTLNFSITTPDPISLAVYDSLKTNASCFGYADGTATVISEGGTLPYSYLWTPINQDSITATGLQAGQIYTVIVTDSLGCVDSIKTSINQPDSLIIQVDVSNTVSVGCFGDSTGTIAVTAQGGTLPYTYNWPYIPSNDSIIDSLPAGEYFVILTDQNQCVDSALIEITQPQATLEATISTKNILCNQPDSLSTGAASAQPTGGTPPYSYQWNDNNNQISQTATGLQAGAYQVTITDSNNCATTMPVIITIPSELDILFTDTLPTCYGDANGVVIAHVSGGTPEYEFYWNGSIQIGDSILNNLVSGNYNITVLDSNNCEISGSYTLTEPDSLNVAIVSQNAILCYGDSTGYAVFDISGGTNPYKLIYNGDTSYTDSIGNLAGSNQQVEIIDSNNCSIIYPFIINTPTMPFEANSLSTTDVSCFDGNDGSCTITLTGGTPPYNYSSGFSAVSANGDSAISTGMAAGSYTVEFTDANNCEGTDTFTIYQPEAINASAIIENDSCFTNIGEIYLETTGGTPPYNYSWSPVALPPLDTIIGVLTGNYTLTITDNNDCIAIIPVDVPNDPCPPIVPDIVTPNDDGINDYLIIKYLEQYSYIDLTIFNRWGNEIIHYHKYKNNWNGKTQSGNTVSDGVYFYILKTPDGQAFTGFFTVMH